MRLTPRGTEVKAIVELLESDAYDSADALAKAIIKTTADLFAERDWYAYVWRENPEAFYLSYGPFPSETEAKKFPLARMLKGQHMILPLFSSAGLLAELEKHKIPSPFCTTCSHQLLSHQHPKIQPKCAVRGCKCKRSTTDG